MHAPQFYEGGHGASVGLTPKKEFQKLGGFPVSRMKRKMLQCLPHAIEGACYLEADRLEEEQTDYAMRHCGCSLVTYA
jgi:hypothetical protein